MLTAFRRAGEVQVPARHRRSTRSATAEERRTERKLIADYEAMLDELHRAKLTPANHQRRGRRSPPSRRKSAASARSSSAISPPPRPKKRRCASSFAPGRAPLLKAAE